MVFIHGYLTLTTQTLVPSCIWSLLAFYYMFQIQTCSISRLGCYNTVETCNWPDRNKDSLKTHMCSQSGYLNSGAQEIRIAQGISCWEKGNVFTGERICLSERFHIVLITFWNTQHGFTEAQKMMESRGQDHILTRNAQMHMSLPSI